MDSIPTEEYIVYITCVVVDLGEFTLQVDSFEEGGDGGDFVRFVELHDSLTNSGDIYTTTLSLWGQWS